VGQGLGRGVYSYPTNGARERVCFATSSPLDRFDLWVQATWHERRRGQERLLLPDVRGSRGSQEDHRSRAAQGYRGTDCELRPVSGAVALQAASGTFAAADTIAPDGLYGRGCVVVIAYQLGGSLDRRHTAGATRVLVPRRALGDTQGQLRDRVDSDASHAARRQVHCMDQ